MCNGLSLFLSLSIRFVIVVVAKSANFMLVLLLLLLLAVVAFVYTTLFVCRSRVGFFSARLSGNVGFVLEPTALEKIQWRLAERSSLLEQSTENHHFMDSLQDSFVVQSRTLFFEFQLMLTYSVSSLQHTFLPTPAATTTTCVCMEYTATKGLPR